MAHYAFMDQNNVVVEVIAGIDETEIVNGITGTEGWEQFYETQRPGLRCKRTSYNGNIRGRYAGIGYTYDPLDDRFLAPQPYLCWTLDANGDWQPPTPYPDDGGQYVWDEATQEWQSVD